MRKQSLIVVMLLLCTSFIAADIAVEEIVIKQFMSDNLSQERALFIKSWSVAYQDHSLHQLHASDVLFFLDEAFDIEEQRYQEGISTYYCYHAFYNNKLVGYIAYELVAPDIAYIRQWALSPEILDSNALRDLIFAILEHNEAITTLCIGDWVLPDSYKRILEEVGFVECDFYADSNKNFHVCYKLAFGDKCGTCFCDYTEEEFEASPVFDLGFEQDCGCAGSDEKICSVREDVCSCSYED